MAELHFTKEDIGSTKDPVRHTANKLIEAGAPIKILSITKVPLEPADIEICGEFEGHPDIYGGIYYVWSRENEVV